MNDYAVYSTGNFTSKLRRFGRPALVYARYGGDTDAHDANQIQVGGALAIAGAGAITFAGGTGVITGTVAASAFEVALCWTGVGLFVLGVAALLYVGYRIFTQKQGTSPGPWQKNTDNPVYMKRINNQMAPIFPPLLLPPAPPPEM